MMIGNDKVHSQYFYLGMVIFTVVPEAPEVNCTVPLMYLVLSVIFNKPKQFPFSSILSTSKPFPLSLISAYMYLSSSVKVILPAIASACLIMFVVASWIIRYN